MRDKSGINFNKDGPPRFSNKGKKEKPDRDNNLRDVINEEKDKEYHQQNY